MERHGGVCGYRFKRERLIMTLVVKSTLAACVNLAAGASLA